MKKHVVALENETTLAHRREMHLFVAEARDGSGNNVAEKTNTDTEMVSTLHHTSICPW